MKDLSTFKAFYQMMLAYLPRGVRWFWPTPPFFTGYEYAELYDWDQYFEAITQLYAGWPCDYIRNGVGIFLNQQHDDGLIWRAVSPGGRTYYKSQVHVKPFLAHELVLCYHVEGTLRWLAEGDRYDRLRKYLVYWLDHEDRRGAGLSVWHEAGHTGMDNHYERAGDWGKETDFCEGVDLNSYLVRECRALALLAGILGRQDDATYFNRRADERAAAIQRFCWDDKAGMFFDHHAKQNELIRVKYVGTFLPLWSGVATKPQADRLVKEHLLNEKEFWRPYPLPGLSADEPGYVEGFPAGHSTGCCSWRAHTFLMTNYLVFQGLRRYGHHDAARELAERTFRMFQRGPFQEYYATESGIGTGLKPFWGFSCLALFMELEADLAVDPTALTPDNRAVKTVRDWIVKNV